MFLSIHGNTYEDPEVSGTEAFYFHDSSHRFAEAIQNHLVDATGYRDRGVAIERFICRQGHGNASCTPGNWLLNKPSG